jgi:AcrR family transcriptional regulator
LFARSIVTAHRARHTQSSRRSGAARHAGTSSVPATTVRRTQAQRIEETRAALIGATIESLAEIGYAATTTREVAERAGVSRGAQTHHFPTKALLVAAAIEHLFATEGARFRQAFSALPAEQRNLDAAVAMLWQIAQSPTYGAVLEVMVAARTDHQLALVVQDVTATFEQTLVELLIDVFPSVEHDEHLARTLLDLAFTIVQGAVISRYAGFGDQERTIQLTRAVASLITPQSGTAILSALEALDTTSDHATEEPA